MWGDFQRLCSKILENREGSLQKELHLKIVALFLSSKK